MEGVQTHHFPKQTQLGQAAAMTTTTIQLEDVFRSEVLPALPSSAISTVAAFSESRLRIQVTSAKPIEADPGLMGQVLKFVNSSYFGFSREIVSIQQALTLVGTRAVTNFALWNAVFSVIPNPKFGPFDLKSLWQDSLRRAIFARKLGKTINVENPEDLFAGALLQDMAIPLLLKELPTEYEELIQRRADEGRRLSGLEKELFGWDHAEAAAMLADRWNLPENFVSLIAEHTHIDDLLAAGKEKHSAACVALASLLPSCTDEEWGEQPEFNESYTKLSQKSSDELAALFAEVDELTAEFAPLLKLPTPKKTLGEY